MNDIRRTILWVVFGFSLVMLWDQWQISQGKTPTFFPQPAQTTSAANTAPVAETPTAAGSAAANLPQVGGTQTATDTSAKRIDVETDVLKLQFSTEGGSLVRVELLKHKDVHREGSNVLLIVSMHRCTAIMRAPNTFEC